MAQKNFEYQIFQRMEHVSNISSPQVGLNLRANQGWHLRNLKCEIRGGLICIHKKE